jgi:hypothetical protein
MVYNTQIISRKNRMYKIILALVIIALMIPLQVLADNAAAQNSSTPAAADAPAANIPGIVYEKQYCPQASSLKLSQDLWWTAPGDWKSDSQSFVSEIDHFIGVQWTGINVGKVICLYRGKGKANFPVAMIRETLVPEPSGNLWGPNQQGQRSCQSDEITDCPFLSEKNKKVGPDIYNQLEFFKNKNDSDQ